MPLTTVDQGLLSTNAQYTGFKNRIINGDMTIDQRNNGAAVTVTTASGFFAADRFANWNQTDGGVTAQQISDAPSGFNNSLRITITSTDTSLAATQYVETRQLIEGFNVADLGWGTANAQTVTLSFWVKSSLTGTFGGSFMNSAVNRAYPFSYTISSANTWEYKTITVPGDTTGTWEKTNGNGMFVILNLGAGVDFQGTANAWVASRKHTVSGAVSLIATNGATWQVTGVQLEKGQTATSFDVLPIGTEMMLCQRYYQQHGFYGVVGQGQNSDRNSGSYVSFFVPMRTTPTTIAKTYDVDIGDLNVSFTPLIYADALGQGIGFRPYRNVSTTITRGDTMEILANAGTEGGPRHPFNAEL